MLVHDVLVQEVVLCLSRSVGLVARRVERVEPRRLCMALLAIHLEFVHVARAPYSLDVVQRPRDERIVLTLRLFDGAASGDLVWVVQLALGRIVGECKVLHLTVMSQVKVYVAVFTELNTQVVRLPMMANHCLGVSTHLMPALAAGFLKLGEGLGGQIVAVFLPNPRIDALLHPGDDVALQVGEKLELLLLTVTTWRDTAVILNGGGALVHLTRVRKSRSARRVLRLSHAGARLPDRVVLLEVLLLLSLGQHGLAAVG